VSFSACPNFGTSVNPKIRGWANYHRHIVAKETFYDVDNQIYCYLWNWAKKRHPEKGKRWLARKYWLRGPKAWIFSTEEKTPEGKRRVELIRAAHTDIRRHVKVRRHKEIICSKAKLTRHSAANIVIYTGI